MTLYLYKPCVERNITLCHSETKCQPCMTNPYRLFWAESVRKYGRAILSLIWLYKRQRLCVAYVIWLTFS